MLVDLVMLYVVVEDMVVVFGDMTVVVDLVVVVLVDVLMVYLMLVDVVVVLVLMIGHFDIYIPFGTPPVTVRPQGNYAPLVKATVATVFTMETMEAPDAPSQLSL